MITRSGADSVLSDIELRSVSHVSTTLEVERDDIHLEQDQPVLVRGFHLPVFITPDLLSVIFQQLTNEPRHLNPQSGESSPRLVLLSSPIANPMRATTTTVSIERSLLL